MGKILKKKKKLKKKIKEEVPVVKKKKLKKKLKVKKKKLKKKLKKAIHIPEEPKGRWCSQKAGALPFPIECHYMQRLNDDCKTCTNMVNYRLWRAGAYVKVEDDIDRGIDFTDPENVPVLLEVEVTAWSQSTTKKRKRKLKKKKKKKT